MNARFLLQAAVVAVVVMPMAAALAHAGHDTAFSQSGGSSRGAAQLHVPVASQSSIGLKTTQVALQTVTPGITTTGHIESDQTRSYVVTPQVAGRVTRLMADLGARVRAGTPLFEVTSPDIGQAQADELQAITRTEGSLLAARSRLTLAKASRDREHTLFQEGIAAKREAQAAEAEYRQASAEAISLQAQLVLAERTLAGRLAALGMGVSQAQQVVRSRRPVNALTVLSAGAGVVIERGVTLGQSVAVDTKAFTIADPARVWAIADVHEQDLAQVAKGQGVEVKVAGDATPYRGTIDFVPTTVDVEKRTAAIRATLKSQGQIRPGMFATIRILAGSHLQALVMPKNAILTDEAGTSVWVKNGDDDFLRQAVVLGNLFGDLQEVKSGVAEGDEVVTVGAFQLAGEAVKQGNAPAHDDHADEAAAPASTPATTVSKPAWPLAAGGAGLLLLGLLAGFLIARMAKRPARGR